MLCENSRDNVPHAFCLALGVGGSPLDPLAYTPIMQPLSHSCLSLLSPKETSHTALGELLCFVFISDHLAVKV